MLVATDAQLTRKVSTGSQLPGSCGDDTVSVPAAKAGAAVMKLPAIARAMKAAWIPFLLIIYSLLFRQPSLGKKAAHAPLVTKWPGAISLRGRTAGSSPTRRIGLGISPSSMARSRPLPGSATGTAESSRRV
ncbi:hypothetical protein D9M68_377430 [compost metagenome]